MLTLSRISLIVLVLMLPVRPQAHGDETGHAEGSRTTATAVEPAVLLNLATPDAVDRCTPTCSQVTVTPSSSAAAPGLGVSIAAGKDGYPGLNIRPDDAVWDLSAFGHVEARIVNTGKQTVRVHLRADNAGDWRDNPWNTESVHIKPGETNTARVIFGYQYGHKPGYKLDPSKIVNVLVFTDRAKEPASFRIESLVAAGPSGETPPVKPKDVRIKPVDGYVLGGRAALDAEKQVDARDGATGRVVTENGHRFLRLDFPANKQSHEVNIRPPAGRWDFTRASEVRVELRNVGAKPVGLTVQVTSDRHHGTTEVSAGVPPMANARQLFVVMFEATDAWEGPSTAVTTAHAAGKPGTGTTFCSDKVDAVKFIVKHEGEAALVIESIMATVMPVRTPGWLGKRPPSAGDWKLTFNDEFDGDTINQDRWNIYTENYWDKRSHFTKDNVVLGGGMARLHMEKKRGHENDDPKRKQTDYAVGFLDTYGKWAQRYGYFEARMKLPTAPGLWPAFWMMPDRGPLSDPQWKRSDTANGGMEFDIMEHLTRWGPCRYNIAMHWDGYGKAHKSLGSSNIYIRPDDEGFITCGLMWTPGSAVYYCNGKVVARWDNDRISNVPSYPILYMVTGGWDNSPLDNAQLPHDFTVDYIRIWQREDLRRKE